MTQKNVLRKICTLLLCAVIFTSTAIPAFMADDSAAAPDPSSSEAGSSSDTVTTGGSPFVTSYSVIDAAGNAVASVGSGQKCCIVVAVEDPRFLKEDTKYLNMLDVKLTSTSNYLTPSRGDIKIVSVKGSSSSPYLRYGVMFNDITYLGGDNTLAFDIAATDNSVPLANVSVAVSNCGNRQQTASGAEPTIMVSGITYGDNAVMAGTSFMLTINAYNTSETTGINNVVTQISLPDSATLGGGSNNALTKAVNANGNFSTSFYLDVANSAPTGMLNISVDFTYYVDGSPEKQSASQVIAVPVMQPDRFSVSSVDTPFELYLGGTDVITVNFINKGKDSLYNLSAILHGNVAEDGLEEYVGNIGAGTKGSVDLDITPNEAGTVSGTIEIMYENENGDIITKEVDYSFEVYERMDYMEQPGDMIIGDEDVLEQKSGLPVWAILLIVLAVAGVATAVIVIIVKKRKAKQAAAYLEDDEDEDF